MEEMKKMMKMMKKASQEAREVVVYVINEEEMLKSLNCALAEVIIVVLEEKVAVGILKEAAVKVLEVVVRMVAVVMVMVLVLVVVVAVKVVLMAIKLQASKVTSAVAAAAWSLMVNLLEDRIQAVELILCHYLTCLIVYWDLSELEMEMKDVFFCFFCEFQPYQFFSQCLRENSEKESENVLFLLSKENQ